MRRIKGHDMAGAMRMINETKVYPLKEGLDVVIIELIQGGLLRCTLYAMHASRISNYKGNVLYGTYLRQFNELRQTANVRTHLRDSATM